MAVSKIDIGTMALLKVGANPIQSFDEGTREAQAVSNMYDEVKRSLLYYTFWNFATEKVELARLAGTPVDVRYKYKYQLPGDVIRVKGIFDQDGIENRDYRVENNILYTNLTQTFLEYIRNMSETNFPPFFTECLVAKLAYEINDAITSVASRSERLAREFENKLTKAKVTDGQENPPSSIIDEGRLVRARLGYSNSVIPQGRR
jgi:hypothetical protein